jgi:hypothetical protein
MNVFDLFQAPCMFNYMTDLSVIDIDPDKVVEIRASGIAIDFF